MLAALGCGHRAPPDVMTPRAEPSEAAAVGVPSPARTLPDPGPLAGSSVRDSVIAAFPDGTRWLLLGGMRVVEHPDGALERAEEVLPSQALRVVHLPAHLGGGLLLSHATNEASPVWRVDGWLDRLGPVTQLWRSSAPIVPGFDRAYVRHTSGDWHAFDPRTGEPMTLGRLPLATRIGSLAFADAWRAAVVTDLLGPLATFDAGNSWHRIAELEYAASVQVADDGDLVFDSTTGRLRLNARGELSREVAAPHAETKAAADERPAQVREAAQWDGRRRPLRLAIETGWPVAERTRDSASRADADADADAAARAAHAVYADSGALFQVRLSDGAIARTREGVMPADARCQAIALGNAFGFVCGATDDSTTLYEFVPPLGVQELTRFTRSRVVFASGTGGVVVRGSCDRSAADTSGSEVAPAKPKPAELAQPRGTSQSSDSSKSRDARQPMFRIQRAELPERFCLIWPGRAEHEIARPESAAIAPRDEVAPRASRPTVHPVALRDGRAALLLAPHRGEPGALVLVSPSTGRVERVPLVVRSPLKALASAAWLDAFEERSPDSLGGWVEVGGQLVGVRVTLEGIIRTGGRSFPTERAIVAGRFGIDWQGGIGQSVETLDGGFSWRAVDLPVADLPAPTPVRNVCGPVGCAAGGWLRVGWGGERGSDWFPPRCPDRSRRQPRPRIRAARSLATPPALRAVPRAPSMTLPGTGPRVARQRSRGMAFAAYRHRR